jgi:DNA modification methylase
MTKNRLYCGDNLEILATMEKESVDLIYIDPSFKSNQDYKLLFGEEVEG